MRRPGIAKCSPGRAIDHEKLAEWFGAWCVRNHISDRDLAAILDVTLALARKKRLGESPLNLIDIKRFPDRHRSSLVLAYMAWCVANDSSALLSHG